MSPSSASPEWLLHKYNNSNHLNNQVDFYQRYGVNNKTWFEWVHQNIIFKDNDAILEVGCGTGELWSQNEKQVVESPIILSDISHEMIITTRNELESHPQEFEYEKINMSKIPYQNNVFDTVIANHALFISPDISKTLSEINRVLKPDGVFYTSTTGPEHLIEIKRFLRNVIDEDIHNEKKFTLENGKSFLRDWFSFIQLTKYDDTLVFEDSKPVLNYLSSKSYYPQDKTDKIAESIQNCLKEHGRITTTNDVGMFICTNSDIRG